MADALWMAPPTLSSRGTIEKKGNRFASNLGTRAKCRVQMRTPCVGARQQFVDCLFGRSSPPLRSDALRVSLVHSVLFNVHAYYAQFLPA